MTRRKAGFTFVELLVAMAIFGVLSAIALPKYRLMREKAWTASLKADLGGLRIAEEAHWAENQRYSADTSQLDWRATSEVQIAIASADFAAGFQATAQHLLMPGSQCSMYIGRETIMGTASGDIICGPTVTAAPGAGAPPP